MKYLIPLVVGFLLGFSMSLNAQKASMVPSKGTAFRLDTVQISAQTIVDGIRAGTADQSDRDALLIMLAQLNMGTK